MPHMFQRNEEHHTRLECHLGCAIKKVVSNVQGNTAQVSNNETYRKNEDSEGNIYALTQGKWQAAMLVSILLAHK